MTAYFCAVVYCGCGTICPKPFVIVANIEYGSAPFLNGPSVKRSAVGSDPGCSFVPWQTTHSVL